MKVHRLSSDGVVQSCTKSEEFGNLLSFYTF
nr:MAG TPA: hypothetical protein [Caudoviricetes sp.]DAU06375.1 MAG TPA: hypothetical protein [Caudoviricetes sp.]